jgi:prepilin-type N-terminal cleavage/methylation domain-containing protein
MHAASLGQSRLDFRNGRSSIKNWNYGKITPYSTNSGSEKAEALAYGMSVAGSVQNRSGSPEPGKNQTRWNKDMKKTAGFTLMELIVVLAIIAIMAGVGVPSYLHYLAAKGPSDAADQLFGDLHRIKHLAIKTRSNATVTFDAAARTYQATLTDPSTGVVTNYAAINLNAFRGGVQIVPDPAGGVNSVGQIGFTFRGTCPVGSAGPVHFTNNGNSSFFRVRTTLAGGVSLHRWNPGSNRWTAK